MGEMRTPRDRSEGALEGSFRLEAVLNAWPVTGRYRRQSGITGVRTGRPEAVVGLVQADSDKLMQHNALAIRSVKARLRSA